VTSPPLPPPLDQGAWDEAATKYAIESLERVRGSAEKWVGTISTLVGLFGAVVVIGGPEALTDIGADGTRYAVFITLGVAAVLAGAAIILGALAAQASTRLWDNWNGTTFAAYIARNGNVAARQLAASRWLGAAAAAAVLGGGLLGTWSALDRPTTESDDHLLVVSDDGTVTCGTLTSSNGKLRLDLRPVADVRQVIVVPKC
jgi:hypothetical protein